MSNAPKNPNLPPITYDEVADFRQLSDRAFDRQLAGFIGEGAIKHDALPEGTHQDRLPGTSHHSALGPRILSREQYIDHVDGNGQNHFD